MTDGHHVSVASKLLLRYGDDAPNQRYHVATAFDAITKSDAVNIMMHLSVPQLRAFRVAVTKAVLATDLKRHSRELAQVRAHMALHMTPTGGGDGDGYSGAAAAADDGLHGPYGVYTRLSNQRFSTPVDISRVFSHAPTLLLRVALMLADVAYTSKGRDHHERWVNMIEQEYFDQGVQEHSLGLRVPRHMDRIRVNTYDLARHQVEFFDHVGRPLFTLATAVIQHSEDICRGFDDNYRIWREKLDTAPTVPAPSNHQGSSSGADGEAAAAGAGIM